MATYNKFDIFVEDLTNKVHDIFGTGGAADALKVYLSNATPSASADAVKADLAEISTGNGYAGAIAATNNGTRSGGTYTLQGTSVQVTASGGAIAQFRYVVLFNDTPTSPADPLIAWWDYGSALDLADGESFAIRFNNAAVGVAGNIATLS